MSMVYLVLALLFSLIIAVMAIANGENVTVNYLYGQARLSLIVLILGSASAGTLTMGFFSLFRGIRTHLKFREERRNQEELQRHLELLEEEKNRLETELGRWQLEREALLLKSLPVKRHRKPEMTRSRFELTKSCVAPPRRRRGGAEPRGCVDFFVSLT